MKISTLILIMLSLAVAGLALWYWAGRESPKEAAQELPPIPTIVAFGDSLIEGQGATSGRDLPSLLTAALGLPVQNFGRSGDTSAQGLARVGAVIAADPDIVIVLFGGNDYLRKLPPDVTFANLKMIVERLKASGATVILLGIRGGIFQDNFANRFETLAAETGALYVPNVLEGLLGNDTYMSDAVHPNDAGYQKIAGKVLPVIQGLIKEKQER